MEKKIEKPITMLRQEFIDVLSDAINNCNLPMFIIEPILKDMYLEVKSLSQQQYEIERKAYESKLKMGDDNKSK